MRFFSSSALASAPKLRFAASCSAAETMARRSEVRPVAIWGSGGRFARLLRRRQDRDRAAGLFHRGDRRPGSAPDREGHFGLQFAAAKQPNAVMGTAQQAGLDQGGGIDCRAGIELAGVDCLLHAAKIDLVQLQLERLVEAALRQPPMQRHLPALESLDAHARARGLALAAASAGLALAGADAAADAHAILARSGPVGDLVEFH